MKKQNILILYRDLTRELIKISKVQPDISSHFQETIRSKLKPLLSQPKGILTQRQKSLNFEPIARALLENLRKFNERQDVILGVFQMAIYKIVRIFTGTSLFVTSQLVLNPSYRSRQREFLEYYDEFRQISSESDKQFVRNMITKVCENKPKRRYPDVEKFLIDHKSETHEIRSPRLNTEKEKWVKERIEAGSPFKQYLQILFSHEHKENSREAIFKELEEKFIIIL